MGTYAKVIADSVSERGHRVTTIEVRLHRFVLAELNTHRVFSRNSASSRAIPLRKQVERVLAEPALPLEWPAEQAGMQGGAPLSDYALDQARTEWLMASQDAAKYASRLHALGHEADERLHKSLPNRLLEPFMWHTVVITSTEWENFFLQRLSTQAQPEIRVAAEMMHEAFSNSTPRLLGEGEWHTPYLSDEEKATLSRVDAAQISAARCARVSYLSHDGKRDLDADLGLYQRLVNAHPAWHGSPLEHVATPWSVNCERQDRTFPDIHGEWQRIIREVPRFGNLLGWRQLRLEVEAEYAHTPGFTRNEDD